MLSMHEARREEGKKCSAPTLPAPNGVPNEFRLSTGETRVESFKFDQVRSDMLCLLVTWSYLGRVSVQQAVMMSANVWF